MAEICLLLLLLLGISSTASHSAPGLSKDALTAKTVIRGQLLGGKNLLANPGHEDNKEWKGYDTGFETDRSVARSGQASARCSNANSDGRRGIFQRIALNQKTPRAVIVAGWSKAEGVDGGKNADYSIYVDLVYNDGTPLWGQVAPFNTGTHDWEFRRVIIYPAKPIREITVNGLLRSHKGTVWFDDFTLAEISGGSTFDGTAVLKDASLAAANNTAVLSTADGLRLGLTAGGSVGSLTAYGREMAVPGIVSGFFARDAMSDSDFVRFDGKATSRPTSSRFQGAIPALSLKLNATFRAMKNSIRVDGEIEDTAGQDRAVSLYFALPINGRGGLWWDDIRQSRRIDAASEYLNAAGCGAGANGKINLYPFSAVTRGANLSLALPLDRPRLYRIAYNARSQQYYIAFDLGLVPETERFPCKASFSFLIYISNPAWGFRAAARKYYDLFPAHYAKRVKQEGIWMPFTDIATVRESKDFGFTFHEGDNNIAFDDRNNIYTFRYTEPMTYWMAMAKDIPRTHEGVMSELERNTRSADSETRKIARAVQVSGAKDETGRLIYNIENAPWCDGAVFTMNNNPDIPNKPDWPNRAHVAWNQEIADNLYNNTARGALDGEYLDSLEGWAIMQNMNREHYRYAQLPLTYATETKKPILLQAFSTYEFTRWMAEDVHRRGKLMMANATPWNFTMYSHLLDVMGTETNWINNNQWQPEGDAIMNLRRTTCYQKPYVLLMNTNYDYMGSDRVEKYFKRSLFYGIFPSMFSHNAADNPYWQNPKLYERDRPLFKRYIPVIRRIARSGWQPVPFARSDNPNVYIERWGTKPGNLYLTVFNPSRTEQTARIQVEAAALKLKGKASVYFPQNRDIRASFSRGKLTITLSLPVEDVAVLALE
ncbi:MAG: hypothetical protein IT210_14265 [Armatimonadetes bacterium]|nr:hypothetical protein [Armatimonadota bacterium]